MMIGIENLRDMIEKINKAESCKIHGRKFLVICLECKETVECGECELRSCQCWNDE